MNRLILLVESRIRGDVYVRFGGELPKTHRSNTAGRWMLSLPMSADDRYKLREQLNAQRTEDYRDDSYARDGGVLDPVTDDTPQFVKEYHDYYKTERGYHRRSPNSNEGITKTSVLSFINMPLLTYISEIRSAVLMIHGEKAHSRYFSEDAYKRLTGSNKELLIILGANHVDLYDKIDVIPFDKIDGFFKNALK